MTTLTGFSIKEEVAAGADEVIALRRYFHQHPEPSLKEYETIKRIKEELDKLDIPYKAVGETGAIGTIEGQKGPGNRAGEHYRGSALPCADPSAGTRFRGKISKNR